MSDEPASRIGSRLTDTRPVGYVKKVLDRYFSPDDGLHGSQDLEGDDTTCASAINRQQPLASGEGPELDRHAADMAEEARADVVLTLRKRHLIAMNAHADITYSMTAAERGLRLAAKTPETCIVAEQRPPRYRQGPCISPMNLGSRHS